MGRVLVTGASTGLGLLTAASLIEQGHEVVLHARAESRLSGQPLLSRAFGAIAGELSSLDEVRSVAEQADAIGAFDAVIHNAGVDKGDALIAVNVVAPYALSALMRRPSRVIVVSSSMHEGGSTAGVADAIAGERAASYSDTKLYATALTNALAHRWPDTIVHSVNPGWVPTRMGGPHAPDDLTEGHRTQEWLATAPASGISPRTGGYWYHREALPPHPATLDGGFQSEVLTALEARTGIALPY